MNDPHRLPTDVLPRRYRLHLAPDLRTFAVQGRVEIDLDVRTATREIVLHAAELEIREARLGGEALQVAFDAARERVTLTPSPLPLGAATVSLAFAGTLSEHMRGFYRSAFTRPDGSQGVLATTQFESTSARRAFPCFDEPALKAVFEVTLDVEPGLTALSNMPVVEHAGRRVRFAPSPVMSTYLLAFIVGELEKIEGRTKDGVAVRVFSTPGRSKLCGFALETAIRGLEWFDAYYDIPYRDAVPKCDLIAIPDFEFGAMENWGAITFRETAIFVDPKSSSVPQRRGVAEVVLHELAHQWFGNLVSPEWWSYLWLNESFATYMAYKAADALFPEWTVWDEYLADISSGGKSLDALRSSHPVEVPVRDPNEVDQLFDAISYNKGGSVLRMLEHAIGAEVFRDGVRRYLKARAYGNATTDDLWAALGPDVPAMMDGWTRTSGHPVVLASPDGTLRQERFLLDRNPDAPDGDPTLWDIPVAAVDASGRTSSIRFTTRETKAPSGWLKLNAGQTGFYLVNYDEAGWAALAKALGTLSSEDRYGLQEDAYVLMRAGYLKVPAYLRFTDAFRDERNHHVWEGLTSGLAALADLFSEEPGAAKLEAKARALVHPALATTGFAENPGDSSDLLLLRATLYGAGVRFGDAEAVAQVKRDFDALRKDPEAVGPNVRPVVLGGAARHGDDGVFDVLVELYEAADLPEVKVQLLGAMGGFRREALLRKAVAYSLSPKVRAQDALYTLGSTPMEMRRTAWALLKENWAAIDARFGKSGLIGFAISGAAGGIPDEAHAADVEAFFQSHPSPYATEKIRQTLESIRARAKFKARNLADFRAYFA
jgi:puromycin-sensitive aminopeptidase